MRHLLGHVAEGQVIGAEQVHVAGQLVPLEYLGRLARQVARRDPDAGRYGAEAEPDQPSAQRMTPAALPLGHAEHGQQPAVGQAGPGPVEDPLVTFGEYGLTAAGQRIARGAVLAARFEDPALAEPRDRRPDRKPLRAKPGPSPG